MIRRESPLNNVLLVLGHVRKDRAHLMHGYRNWFHDVWLVKSDPSDCDNKWENLECLVEVMSRLTPLMKDLHLQLEQRRDHQCTDKQPVGLLYMHFDFWFNPTLFP